MIVQCPSCSKRYRVDDSNIPPSGGKIRCPECSHAFVVYPDSDDSDQQSNPDSHEEPGAKTSVAQRPDMDQLLNNMQGGGDQAGQAGGQTGQGGQQGQQAGHQQQGQDPAADDDEEVAKTEVMAGDELPDFNNLFGEGGPPEEDESTVEMENPLTGDDQPGQSGQQHQQQPQHGQPQQGQPQGGAEDNLKTEQLDSDVVDQSLGHVRDQADSSQPVEQPPQEGGPATQVTPPPNVDQVPDSGGQNRASASDHPTPPPGADQGGGGGPAGGQQGGVPGQQSGQQSGGFGQQPDDQQPGGQQGHMPGQSGPGQQGGAGGPAGGQQSGGFGQQSGGQQANTPGQSGPGHQGGGGGGPADPGGPGAGGGGQQPPQPDGSGGDGPDPTHDGPWKLETNFGLTYEFADTESLKEWLDGRDELDGYQLSADEGDNFYPLDDFPQVGGGGPATSGANAQISSSGRQQQPPVPGDPSGGESGPLGTGSQSTAGGSGARSPSNSGGQPSSPGVGGQPSSPGVGRQPSSPGRQPSSPGSGASRQPSSPGGSGPIPSSSGPSSGGGGGHSPFQTASGQEVDDSAEEPQPDQKEKIDPDEKFEPPSRDSALLNRVLWGLFVLLAVAATVLALVLAGVIDQDLIGDDDEEPAVEQQAVVDEEPDEEVAGQDEDEADDPGPGGIVELFDEARDEMEQGNYEAALDPLEEARETDEESIRVYELKEEVYEELGDDEQAQQNHDRARHLREEGELPGDASEDDEE